jgi:predicted nucleic acid-binding protein
MSAEAFLDTNILIYALTASDPRCSIAQSLLRAGGVISVQALNEFANVARRKLRRSWPEVELALSTLRLLFPNPRSITAGTHEAALTIAQAEGYSFYDALIVASALEARCTTLLTEDLQHGRVIRGSLTIRDPFVAR